MIADDAVRQRLTMAILNSLRDGAMLPSHWADIIRYVTGTVTPVMDMREGVAQKVLDFYEIEERKRVRLN